MYTYIYIYTHTHIYIHICIYIQIYIYIYICIYMYIHIRMYVCIHTYMYSYLFIHNYIGAYILTLVYTRAHIYTYTHIHTHPLHPHSYIPGFCRRPKSCKVYDSLMDMNSVSGVSAATHRLAGGNATWKSISSIHSLSWRAYICMCIKKYEFS